MMLSICCCLALAILLLTPFLAQQFSMKAQAYAPPTSPCGDGTAVMNPDDGGYFNRDRPPQRIGDALTDVDIMLTPHVPYLPLNTALLPANNYNGNLSASIRLCDISDGHTIQQTTYDITIKKIAQNKVLFHGAFYSKNGTLVMNMLHRTEQGKAENGTRDTGAVATVVGGQRNSSLLMNNTVVAANHNDAATIRVPEGFTTGMHLFEIRILAANAGGTQPSVFNKSDAPTFNVWRYLEQPIPEQITIANGKTYNLTVLTQSDKPEDFRFDDKKGTLTWSIPYFWNTTELTPKDMIVHQDIMMPNSIDELSSANDVNAMVNGFPIIHERGAVYIDRTSSNSTLVVHLILNKNGILAAAKGVPANTSKMYFSVSFSQATVPEFPLQVFAPSAAAMGIVILANRGVLRWTTSHVLLGLIWRALYRKP
jgi:hypothetical protein